MPRRGIDMPGWSNIYNRRSPTFCEIFSSLQRDVRILAAGHDNRRKRKPLQWHGLESNRIFRKIRLLYVGGPNQHCALDLQRILRRPMRNRNRPATVPNEHDIWPMLLNRSLDRVHPLGAKRALIITLMNSMSVGKPMLPMRLPMIRTRVEETRNGENSCHRKRSFEFQVSTTELSQTGKRRFFWADSVG